MSLPEIVSGADLSALLGVGKRQVDRLAEQGIVVREGRDAFRLIPSAQGYTRYRERQIEERLGGEHSYQRARTERMREAAAEARLHRLEREGKLVDVDEIARCWDAIVDVVKKAFWSLPARAAPRAAMKPTAEVEKILREFVRQILDHLSRMRPAATKFGARRDGNGPHLEEAVE